MSTRGSDEDQLQLLTFFKQKKSQRNVDSTFYDGKSFSMVSQRLVFDLVISHTKHVLVAFPRSTAEWPNLMTKYPITFRKPF